uniref:SEL1L2 adaptor subunit of ERAD E3 ligase n=1 Tax=Canis lupus familiaris TaxID=9615 RepID=A0A8I3PCT1_CANLF
MIIWSYLLEGSSMKEGERKPYVFFAKAADMGNLKAMEKMADALLFGNFGMQNITAAIQLYESLAKEGSYTAQNVRLGYDKMLDTALIYYTFGSAGGSMMSQMILGYRYLSGINVLQKYVKGVPSLNHSEIWINWVHISILQIQFWAKRRGDVQIQKALYYFLKAAKAGSANAMAFIGKMYLEGNAAAPQNNATAFKYFSMAANKGNAIGLHGLGLLYFYGKGVPVNYAEALKYFQKAAEKGWPNAQFQLGFMYYSGSGVWKDYKLAFKYFYLASQSGQPLAIYYLAEMYATGTGVLRSCRTAVEKRLKFLKRRRCIQWHFSYGIELPFKDIHLARRLYDMAAQTSPDAHIPVFFALMKLETVHLLRDILFFNQFTMRWKWMKLDNTLGPYWDLFVIGLIIVVLIFLLRNRYG